MENILKERLTYDVFKNILGDEPSLWKNFTNCALGDPIKFRNIIGGVARTNLDNWIINMLLENMIQSEISLKESMLLRLREAEN